MPALLLAGVASFALVASDLGLEHHGVPADEAFYHAAARRHVAWLSTLGAPGSFSAQTLDAHFAWQPQVVVHPTFSRLLSGASWRLFHGAFGLDAITAYRLHNALAYALVALGIAWFCARSWGPACGVVCVLIFWSNARFFGHAHTAMTDVVLSCLWLWAPLLLLRGVIEERRGSVLVAALLSGFALATKLTGSAVADQEQEEDPVRAHTLSGPVARAAALAGVIALLALARPAEATVEFAEWDPAALGDLIAEAAGAQKHLLLVVTQPDWCPPCIRLDRDILGNPDEKRDRRAGTHGWLAIEVLGYDAPGALLLRQHGIQFIGTPTTYPAGAGGGRAPAVWRLARARGHRWLPERLRRSVWRWPQSGHDPVAAAHALATEQQ